MRESWTAPVDVTFALEAVFENEINKAFDDNRNVLRCEDLTIQIRQRFHFRCFTKTRVQHVRQFRQRRRQVQESIGHKAKNDTGEFFTFLVS